MREPIDRGRLMEFMRALAAAARVPLQVYLVGGATAVFERVARLDD
jgi:UDP-N-acetyl-D-mannosaminuronic acid transferase (WecB/TagA/CpsF family)